MTFFEIKKKLSEYKDLKKLLNSEQERIATLRSQIYNVKATDYSSERVSGTRENTYLESILDRIDLLEKRADNLMQMLFETEDLIADNMDNLSAIEQAMVIDRYMNGWSWKKISEKYNYEESQPYKIIKRAIRKMAQVKEDSKR